MSNSHKCKIRGKYKRKSIKARKEFYLIWRRLYPSNPDNLSFTPFWTYVWHQCKKQKIDPWDLLSEENKKIIVNYSKSPSWYNSMFYHSPARRIERDNLKKITLKSSEEFKETDLYINNKPVVYFW
jgi:hypothetical protein